MTAQLSLSLDTPALNRPRSTVRALGRPMKRRRAPIAVRLWEKVDTSGGPDACWPWLGATMHNGYGHIGLGRKVVASHRTAYEDAVGPIPAGLYILHHCDNRICCNPAHLWAGTQGDNLRDMYAKGRGWRQVQAARTRTERKQGQTAVYFLEGQV